MREIRYESPSPMLVQLRPPSVDRYTPSPQELARVLAGSPVPTQTTSGSDGATATAPVEAEPSVLKMGSYVVPWLVVFQTPPPAVVRYWVLGSDSTPTTVHARPAGMDGPKSRHSRVAVCSGVRG